MPHNIVTPHEPTEDEIRAGEEMARRQQRAADDDAELEAWLGWNPRLQPVEDVVRAAVFKCMDAAKKCDHAREALEAKIAETEKASPTETAPRSTPRR